MNIQGWEEKTIGEIADVKGGKRLPYGHDFTDKSTQTAYIRVTDLVRGSVNVNNLKYISFETEQLIKNYKIYENDVYISIAGTIGLVGKIPRKLNGSNLTENAAKITNISDGVSSDFLSVALCSDNVQVQIDAFVGSAVQPKLALFRIKAIKIHLPTSVEEQRKIAAVLSKVDEAIEQTRALIAKNEQIKTGLMQDLLTRGIDENGTIRSQQTHAFKDSPLGRIPVEWEVAFFSDIADLISEKYLPSNTNTQKCINLDHIESNTGSLIDTVDSSINRSIKSKFRKGDVLFSKLRPYLKKYLLVDFEGVCTTEILVFRPKENNISFLLFLFVQTDKFINYTVGQSFGTKMPRTDWKIISNFEIPLIPIEEQKMIANKVIQFDKYLQNERAELSKLELLKSGLMQDLLSGKVRVA
ncbi:type I restriction enzyme, S subunit [Flexibacter flexilis DSM 6793]|uniref:Type I restriction enzyme, S subunit n=1 Tax=Flexibacter flexilis DSM 6793 TaxID=927664 RepID=A0A1I1NW72_9BACT|nr:restriction endonuclease subunit S [Flexibacter flexilis]SFD01572.1 type I restriction enzyme, S subunit [Flexibacter flexilis DSM 6793]